MAGPANPFDIDPRALDREWRDQPGRARAAGVREADARHAQAQAQAALKVTFARLLLTIRRNPGSFDLRDKATVDEVEAAVIVHPDHIAAQARLDAAEYAVNVAKADTTAYVDRRKALEAQVDLLGMDYQSEREPVARTEEGRKKTPRPKMDAGIEFDPDRE